MPSFVVKTNLWFSERAANIWTSKPPVMSVTPPDPFLSPSEVDDANKLMQVTQAKQEAFEEYPAGFRWCTNFAKSRTQKVRGLNATGQWRRFYRTTPASAVRDWKYVSAQTVVNSPILCQEVAHGLVFPLFARPCPTVPRHGFVDSKLVRSPEELMRMCHEIVAVEPQGEVLLTPFINGDHSAVVTPTTFSVGEGHEGATSGKSSTLYGPGMNHQSNVMQNATINAPDVPYFELVADDEGAFHCVQVRGGPAQSAVVDFVPKDVVVNKVLVATIGTDLLQWEKDIANATTGTVVYADGLSLASHFCVHAVVHGVPVLTSKEPHVADFIEATGVPVWSNADWRALARQVTYFDKVIAQREQANAISAVMALHLAGTPCPASGPQLNMLALGAVTAVKCMTSAVLGEARHVYHNSYDLYTGKGRELQQPPSRVVFAGVGKGSGMRGHMYRLGHTLSIDACAEVAFALGPIYRHRRWDRAFGGKKWGAINAGVRRMAEKLGQFRRSPSAKAWAAFVTEWNETIHREHNGHAPSLNKFGISSDDMDNCAYYPFWGFNRASKELVKDVFGGPIAIHRDCRVHPAKNTGRTKHEVLVRFGHSEYGRVVIQDYYSQKTLFMITDDALKAEIRKLSSHSAKVYCRFETVSPTSRTKLALQTLNKLMLSSEIGAGINLVAAGVRVQDLKLGRYRVPVRPTTVQVEDVSAIDPV